MVKHKWKKLHWQMLLLLSLLLGVVSLIYWSRFHTVHLELGLYTDSSWNVPSDEGTRLMDHVIAKFEKEHPNVKVTYESGIDKDDYADWLSDKIVLGQTPDIFMVPDGSFSSLAQNQTLLNLSPYFKKLNTNDFYQSSLKAGQYRGKSYGLPYENNVMMLCINKDLLKQAGVRIPEEGWDLEEFYQLCKRLTKDTDGDGNLDQFGVTEYSWRDAVSAYGLSIFAADNSQKVSINNPQIKSALDYYTKLDKLSGTTKLTSKDFDKGNVAFMPMTLAEYRTYKPYPYHVAKYSSFEWTCVRMPVKSSRVIPNQLQTSLFGISSKSGHKSLAWEFMKLLVENEHQSQLMKNSPGASVKKSVVTSSSMTKLFNQDSLGGNALTTDNLTAMLSHSRVEPRSLTTQEILDKADYLIAQSISEDSLDDDLQAIQDKLNQ
ncbi:ABC transporter substrate-binding protein [Streptococcus dentasini]